MGADASKRSNLKDNRNHKYIDTKVILLFFSTIGLAPFKMVANDLVGTDKRTCQTPVSVKFVDSYFNLIYNAFLIVANIFLSTISIERIFERQSVLRTPFLSTFDAAQAVFGVALMNAIWLYTSMKRNHMVRLINRLVKVDSTIRRLSNSQDIGIRRLRVFGISTALTILWVVLVVSDAKANNTVILDWCNDIVPAFVIAHFMLQYALMVKIVEIQFRNLNGAIIELLKSSTIRTFRPIAIHGEIALMNFDYCPKIVDFRRAHNMLYAIGSDVAEFYSVPILFVIPLCCVEIVYNSYWGLMPLTLSLDIDSTFVVSSAITWVLVLIVPIAILTKGVDNITNEMRNTAGAIYMVLDRANLSRDDKAEFEQFSVELIHRKIYFTAYGLFSLDFPLVHSIISMTVTYLVILLQFQTSIVESKDSD
ncbi:putative gustatory receptor 28a [Venturia canescens]|uniref:putative gustatory receptor 28a n=1 Tax=Venturia canescens TaxID=32260 RepID=UPI001C9C1A75|nr:putative gustatory receptor 28a [Venturia canescens]